MTQSKSDTSSDVAISIRNLFKIFGDNPASVMPQLYDGIDKADIQQKTGHVIGLNNINVDIQSGKITVIMGLSGSGKSTLIRHINRLIEPTAGEILLDGKTFLIYPKTSCGNCGKRACPWCFRNSLCFPIKRYCKTQCLRRWCETKTR